MKKNIKKLDSQLSKFKKRLQRSKDFLEVEEDEILKKIKKLRQSLNDLLDAEVEMKKLTKKSLCKNIKKVIKNF